MNISHRLITFILGLILLIGFPFFFYGGPGYHATRSFLAAWDLGHILYFALTTSFVLTLLEQKGNKPSPLFLFSSLFILVLILGVSIELLQSISGNRSPDMMDVVRNQLGCMLSFVFSPHSLRTHKENLWKGLRFVVLLCLLTALWPLTQALIDEQTARSQFPILSDFETPFEKLRWSNPLQLKSESSIVRNGKKAMRVQLSTAKYSGTSLFYFPGNWQDFRLLHWSAYNPQTKELTLTLRINDKEHKQHGSAYADRFNKQFVLQPGWNDLVVDLDQVRHAPHGRVMNMQHLETLGLFVVQQEQPQELILDYFYLSH